MQILGCSGRLLVGLLLCLNRVLGVLLLSLALDLVAFVKKELELAGLE